MLDEHLKTIRKWGLKSGSRLAGVVLIQAKTREAAASTLLPTIQNKTDIGSLVVKHKGRVISPSYYVMYGDALTVTLTMPKDFSGAMELYYRLESITNEELTDVEHLTGFSCWKVSRSMIAVFNSNSTLPNIIIIV